MAAPTDACGEGGAMLSQPLRPVLPPPLIRCYFIQDLLTAIPGPLRGRFIPTRCCDGDVVMGVPIPALAVPRQKQKPRRLKNPRAGSSLKSLAARRPEKHAPPPGSLGLWADWDADRFA